MRAALARCAWAAAIAAALWPRGPAPHADVADPPAPRPAATPAAAVSTATAASIASPVRLAALAPADDARRALVIGVDGEVFEPDGAGRWLRRLPCNTARPVVAAGRAGDAVVALGDGVVFRLAANGWSALRLAQRGKAILGSGRRAVAAVGRQLFSLEALTGGEPTRLALAPAPIVALSGGARTIVVTTAGAYRLDGARLVPLRGLPAGARPVSDRFALVERGVVDLATSRITRWPGELTVGVTAEAPDDGLVAMATGPAGLELVTLRRGAITRDPLGLAGTAVGVVVDRAARAVVALADGRVAIRDRGGWTTTQVAEADVPPRPGAAPARSR